MAGPQYPLYPLAQPVTGRTASVLVGTGARMFRKVGVDADGREVFEEIQPVVPAADSPVVVTEPAR